MANAAVAGVLRVILGGDTSELNSALKEASANIGKHASDIARTAAAIGAAITAAYAVVAVGVKDTLKSMDEINKSSQKMGVPVEQLSALKLAADLSDVSMEALSKGVGKLSKTMVEAAGQPTSEAANAFRALGVSVTDSNGKLRPVIDVTKDVATKFEDLKDGAGKTAASMAIFGKSGAELIPLLNAGGAGIADMMQKAQALGITFDKDTAAAAEKFRDTLTTLGAAKDGLIVKLTAYLLPALQQFADRMLAGATNATKQEEKLSILKTSFDLVARAVLLVADNFKIFMQIGAVLVGAQIASSVIGMGLAFVKMAMAIREAGLVLAAFEAIRKISMFGLLAIAGVIAVATGNFDNLKSGLNTVYQSVAKLMPEGAGELGKAFGGLGLNLDALTADLTKFKLGTDGAAKGQADFNYQALAGKNAVDQYINSQKKSLEGQAAEIKTFGMLPGSMEAAKMQLQALSIATANHTTITAAQQLQLDATKKKAIEYGQTLAGLQMTQANLTPAQIYQQELFKIQSLFDNGKISAETYGQAMQKAAESANATWAQAGESIAGSFATISGAFGKESSSMATAAKVFGVIQGTISMFTGAAKALELPFPANIAAVAAVLAKGASLVASIKSQSVPTGYMTGGSFTVGGTGGPDSTPVSFMASPGEQVDVWRPDQGGGTDPRGGSSRGATVNLSMPIATTREALRDLIEGLNGMFSDGYRLNIQPA